ncbi:MAG: ABC transporter permease subunit [Candidatus Eisenbacteria bacterium]|nr:ABC transporter permease subunit [Candidatus Eisenbacteria bacterium]
MRIAEVALHTLRETVRDRVFLVSLFFAAALIGSSLVVSALAAGQQDKVIKDVGLAAISAIGILLSAFVGASLVHREVQRRTIYTLLARPVGRTEYVVGKYLGMVLTLALNVAIMAVFFGLLVHFHLHSLRWAHLAAIYMIGLELFLVAAFSILFSTIASPVVSACFTLSVYFVGHLVSDIRGFAEMLPSDAAAWLTRAVCLLLPNLEYFDVKGMAVYGKTIEPALVGNATLYGLVYTAGVVLVAAVLFRRKDLQ